MQWWVHFGLIIFFFHTLITTVLDEFSFFFPTLISHQWVLCRFLFFLFLPSIHINTFNGKYCFGWIFFFFPYIHSLFSIVAAEFSFRFHKLHGFMHTCTHTHMWWISKMLQYTKINLNCIKIWNRMTASILTQDPNTKRFKRMLIYFNTDTVCKFSGKSPLSSHKTTLCICVKINKRSFEPFCVSILNCIKRPKTHTTPLQWLLHGKDLNVSTSFCNKPCCSRQFFKHIKGSKEHCLLGQKHNLLIFGEPLYQATKRHLNNS